MAKACLWLKFTLLKQYQELYNNNDRVYIHHIYISVYSIFWALHGLLYLMHGSSFVCWASACFVLLLHIPLKRLSFLQLLQICPQKGLCVSWSEFPLYLNFLYFSFVFYAAFNYFLHFSPVLDFLIMSVFILLLFQAWPSVSILLAQDKTCSLLILPVSFITLVHLLFLLSLSGH